MQCSLYIHVPFCESKCDYCDFYSLPTNDFSSVLQKKYLNALYLQLQSFAERFSVSAWKTVYVGGGTPSLLSASSVKELSSIIRRVAPILPNAEFSIECNPQDLTLDWLESCEQAGIDRISCGLQTMEENPLLFVHRRTTVSDNRRVLKLLNENWKKDWSCDFIAGLPNSTKKSFLLGLEEALSYSLKHCSLYALTIDDDTPLGKRFSEKKRNAMEENIFEQWNFAAELLEKTGLKRYEVSNFSVSQFESRHNLAYWQSDSWLGVGPAASGTIQQGKTSLRITTKPNFSAWLDSPCDFYTEEKIAQVDTIKDFLMMGFRLCEGIPKKAFLARFEEKLEDVLQPLLDKWKNYLVITENRFFLNSFGMDYLNLFLEDVFNTVDSFFLSYDFCNLVEKNHNPK